MNRMLTFGGLRGEYHSHWPEWSALSLYAALVAFAIPYHEPFSDEAQAWQLARCLSLPALFQNYIRYEGSPGLWHFLLWIMVRAHVSYAGLHWICGAIALGATALLLFKSPFPRYLKLALPFTFFLLFQYAVVARSYVLMPLLLYLIALSWKKSPLILALLLGLLANVELHATVISGALAVVYVIEIVRNRGERKSYHWHQLLWSAGILLGFWAFAVWTALPPPDLNKYLATRVGASWPLFMVRTSASVLWPVCQPWILSIPFWIAIALCLRARHSLFYLFPVLLFAIFCGAAAHGWWHLGIVVPLLICILWITWPASGGIVYRSEAAARIALIAMVSAQILWSAFAIEYDHYNAYSPDLATAEFLRPFVRQGATIAVTYLDDPGAETFRVFGILPYYDHDIFMNVPNLFWSWSNQNQTEKMFLEVLPSHPTLIIVETQPYYSDVPIHLESSKIELLNRSGYKFTNMFCGAMPMRFELQEKSCHLIFQRDDALQ